MRIGLIDVDGHNFPNIPLMKLSAWHKAQGDSVEWYQPFNGFAQEFDKVYLSKVFGFSEYYSLPIYSKEIIKGGSGYCITTKDGKEIYDKSKDRELPFEVEHIFPDYSIYNIKDTAYGFLSRGCPRGCDFCHVKDKEGRKSYKVANLSEFWDGQKNIVICDPNIIACKDWQDLLGQLIESNSKIEINQGIDIRLMNEEKAELFKNLKVNYLHFAWDRYEDKCEIIDKLKMFKEITQIDHRKAMVYVLVNFNTTFEQDLERIYTIRNLGYDPFVMIYNKSGLKKGSKYNKLARWVNNKFCFWACDNFNNFEEVTK